MTYEDDGSLGGRFWLRVFGVIVAGGAAALVIFFLFSTIWYAWSLLGALIVLAGALLAVAYIHDRRAQREFGRE